MGNNEINQLFGLRNKEVELLTFGSQVYGKIQLLLKQYRIYQGEPRILLAISQRIDDLRFNLNNVANNYLQIYESSETPTIKKVAKDLETNVRKTIQDIEDSLV